LLRGAPSLTRQAIYWHFPHYSNHGMQSPGAAIRAGDYKLIEYFENQTVQLFNLKHDIGEQHDLADAEPERRDALHQLLKQWRTAVSANMMELNPEFKMSGDAR